MSENGPTEPAPLPERPARKRGLLAAAAVVVVAAVAAVVVLTKSDETSSADTVTVRIGTTEASAQYWPTFRQVAEEHGVTLDVVSFSDYTQPNAALSQGQLDLNLFQHLLFLANYNVSNEDTLTPIASTYVVPLSLYSQKYTDVADIPRGGTIAIPNDPTNQARALLVLQQAKLITLTGGGTVLSTPAEIDTAASKVTVTPIDAAQTVASLPSVDASIVNNNFALAGGLDPEAAIYGDDPARPAAEPYINAIVAREQDKDDPTFQKVIEAYRDERVAKLVAAESKGTSVPVDRPVRDLLGILAGLSDTIRSTEQ